MRSDNEQSLLSLIERVMSNLTGVELVLMTSPEAEHAANGLAEVGVREIMAQTRILRSQLEQRLGNWIDEKHPLMSWIPRHAANCVSRYRIMDVGRTPDQRRCGKTWKRPVVDFGESVHFRPVGENSAIRGGDQRMLCGVYVRNHERSGAAIFLTPDGVSTTDGLRVQCHMCRSFMAAETRSAELGKACCTCGRGRSTCCACDRDPCCSENDRRRYVTKRDLAKYGYTDECLACTQLSSGMHNAKVLHDERCRDRIGELTEDDDQRQVERVSGNVRSEVEIPRLEAGEEMDVGEPLVGITQSVPQPVPTVRVGGASSSGTRSGSRANETNSDDRDRKP